MKLRSVCVSDARFLYQLLEERPALASVSHKEMPTWEEHLQFVKSYPYSAWYIVEDDAGIAQGSVYLTIHDEIGVAIAGGSQGKGLGSQAVRMLMEQHQRREYRALIACKNERSQALFERLGFAMKASVFVWAKA